MRERFQTLQQAVIPYIWLDKPKDQMPTVEPLLPSPILFAGGGEVSQLAEQTALFGAPALANKPLFVHIDLVDGMTKDDAGLRVLRTVCDVDGIISVKAHAIEAAKRQGLGTVLRVFLQDTRALERGLAMAKRCQPDALELLPAVAAAMVVPQLKALSMPLIAAGLLQDERQVQAVLKQGFSAVSTSRQALWGLGKG